MSSSESLQPEGSTSKERKPPSKWEKARAEPLFKWEGNEYYQVRLHGSAWHRPTLGRVLVDSNPV